MGGASKNTYFADGFANIFDCSRLCPEDAFSLGFAYILDSIPSVGQRVVDRIAELSGSGDKGLGNFVGCRFTGLGFIGSHRQSKPDVLIRTDEMDILVESKLDAGLSVRQVEKHARAASVGREVRVVFISLKNYRCGRLRGIPGYIAPQEDDHFLWKHLLEEFSPSEGCGRIERKLLRDFRSVMRMYGVYERKFLNKRGSVYDCQSEAQDAVLVALGKIMRGEGFRVLSKKKNETTLRVYMPSAERKYPLLNPRFIPSWCGWGDSDQEFLLISAYERVDGNLVDFGKFINTDQCFWWAERVDGSALISQGYFLIPLSKNYILGNVDAGVREIFKFLVSQ